MFHVLTSRQPPGIQLSGSRHDEVRPFVLPYRVTRWRTRDTFLIFIRCEATGERFLGRGYWQTVATFRGHIYVFTVDQRRMSLPTVCVYVYACIHTYIFLCIRTRLPHSFCQHVVRILVTRLLYARLRQTLLDNRRMETGVMRWNWNKLAWCHLRTMFGVILAKWSRTWTYQEIMEHQNKYRTEVCIDIFNVKEAKLFTWRKMDI